MRRSSSASGGIVWRRMCSKCGERGDPLTSIASRMKSGVRRLNPLTKYHSPATASWSSTCSGSNVSGSGR